MRILAIRGENLASLEGPFEIDLADGILGQTGLFSITGSTGAGKSTLLDALCLALYDETPRLADAKVVYVGQQEEEKERENAKDVKSIMRRGTGHCRAEVDFIGKDNVRYRARWEARRARNNPGGRLQNQTLTLEKLETGERIGDRKTEVLEAIESRTGLSFDQFRRSVLLAQGDFAAFLKADANQRADLLERMTGTEIYSRISVAAYQRMKAEVSALELLRSQRDGLVVLGDEARREKEEELEAAGGQLEAEKGTEKVAGQAITWYLEAKKLRDDVGKGERSEKEARERFDEAESRRTLLARVKEAESFRGALEGLDRVERDREESRKEAGEAAARASDAEGRRTTAQETVASLSRRIAAIAAKEEARREGAGVWLRENQAMGPIEKGWKQVSADIRSLATTGPALRKTREKARALLPVLTRSEDEEAFNQGLEKAIASARDELKAAEAAQSLDDRRAELVSGEPCPLCGSKDHPWADGSPLSTLVAERRALVSTLEGTAQEIRELDSNRRGALARLADPLEGIPEWEETLEEDPHGFLRDLEEKVLRHRAEVDAHDQAERLLHRIDGLLSTEERRRLLQVVGVAGDEDPTLTVDELISALNEARKEEKGAGEEAVEAAATAKTRGDQAKKLERDWEVLSQDLHARVATAGMTMEELRKRLSHDGLWLEEEEKALEAIRQRLSDARTVLAERKRLEESHLAGGPPEMTEEGALAERQRVEGVIESLHRSIGILRAKLEEDENRRKEAEELKGRIAAQEEVTDLWRRLGTVIGSADGKKLRRFAQSLTLRSLIDHANVHLNELVRRYRLERVPTTDMDIQVVDQEMADEVRSVNSLSGGETFLVSLALALGLASLSAREMSVESLFIDEGFGSLDIDTLEVALAALESLQASGRQVGIISHVQGLGDHIGAQVLVEKVGAGRSRVVVGG